MSRKIIHVNRQYIAFNAKAGDVILPTYIVREGNKRPIYAFGVNIRGPVTLVDTRNLQKQQLKCGARAWIETDSEIEYIGAMDFQTAEKIRKEYKNE